MKTCHCLAERRGARHSGDLGPARIRVGVAVLGVGLEDADRGGLGEQPELVGGALHLSRPRSDHLGLDEQAREHRDLGAQLVHVDRCGDEVDGALRVAVGPDLAGLVRGDEDDRGHLRLPPQPDQGCRLEPVHDRHPDVEQDDGEVVRHQATQGRSAGVGLHDVVAQGRQHGLQCQPLRLVVVDDEDGDGPREVAEAASLSCSMVADMSLMRGPPSAESGATESGTRGAGRGPPAWARSRQLRHRGTVGVRRPRPCR